MAEDYVNKSSLDKINSLSIHFDVKVYNIFYILYTGLQKIIDKTNIKYNEKIELFLIALKKVNIFENLENNELKGKAMMLDLFNKGNIVEIILSIFFEEYIEKVLKNTELSNEIEIKIRSIAYKAYNDFILNYSSTSSNSGLPA